MKNSQRAGSQDDRAGTARMRRWSEEKLSVRLFLVAFVLVLTGALAWDGWFASASQNATWTPVLVTIAVVRGNRSRHSQAAVLDVTISLTGSAGLRQAWPRRALAIARAGVAVAASGDGSACPSVPADRAISGAPQGACAAGRGRQRRRFRGRDAGGRLGQRLGPASGRTVRFVMGGLGGCHRDW